MGTLRDMVMKALCEGGFEEAHAITVTSADGESLTIHSDDHPALDRPAAEFVKVEPKQTAEGG